MIPNDAIAIVTPHGRYERVMRGRRTASPAATTPPWTRSHGNGTPKHMTANSPTWFATPV